MEMMESIKMKEIKNQKLPGVNDPIVSEGYKRHKCPNCTLAFKYFSDLRSHLLIGTSKIHACPECDQYFSSLKGMKQHFGKVHQKTRSSRCHLCKRKYCNKYSLKNHVVQVHSGLGRVMCPDCDKDYYNQYSLIRHSQSCRGRVKLEVIDELI
jgi:uncharacterized C2H2 Zn-finger protein